MNRFVHTNLIARDAAKLIAFYKAVFGCKSIGQARDLRGAWLDKLTGLRDAHLVGEHLLLPGYGEDHPTLEIFSYGEEKAAIPAEINRPGIGHIAFEVDDVEETLREVLRMGGSAYGELVTAAYPDGIEAVFVYAKDPEGNIIELQSWRKQKENEKMNNMIAYCGLNCEHCDAYIATVNDDDALREKTAKLWAELNNAPITREMINCTGCRSDGIKTPFCDSMCEIRKCARKQAVESCGKCEKMGACEDIAAVMRSSEEAKENLQKQQP